MTGTVQYANRVSSFIAPSRSSSPRSYETGSKLSMIPQNVPVFSKLEPSMILQQQSMFVDSSSVIAEAGVVPSTTFEPVMPDTSLLWGFGAVAILCIIAANVWANEVVPVSRTKLAISKSRGEVREYLDELKEGSINASKSLEETITSEDIESDESKSTKPNVGDGRDFERWLFSDWLNNDSGTGKPGRQKEPALPVLKKAKWNSGDNPVLVTSAIMLLGVLIASVTERVSSLPGTT
mmetsp:Transcript_40534/g.61456  ORF Transcript_40534/g.61456 Transcript_40534/m.61456 type:complete len:237 (-) Transcript_40534:121-831(-)